MLRQIGRDFLMLLVTVDPIGTVALFVPLTLALSVQQRRAVARKAVLVAGCVLLAFLVAGEIVLGAMDVAVFPLALPGIASPGAITAVVLLTDNNRHSLAQQAVTAAVVVVVLAITLGLLYAASMIHRLLGSTGANVLIRVLGLVLAALAVEQVVAGVEVLVQRSP